MDIATYGKKTGKRKEYNTDGRVTLKKGHKEKGNNNPVSWWDMECEKAIANRKAKLQTFKKTKKMEDFIKYKRLRAVARKIVKRKKREDLHRNFAASLNKNISIKYVWGKMKALKKRWAKVDWHEWQIKNRLQEIEKTVNKVVSPWVNKDKKKEIEESRKKDYNLNNKLTKEELDRAIQYTKNSSTPGIDSIEYIMIKLLPKKYKIELSKIMNYCFEKGIMMKDWKRNVTNS